MTTDLLPDLADRFGSPVRRAVQWVAADFPGVDRGRIEQALWGWVREHEDLLDYHACEPSLVRLAERAALQYRADHLYGTAQYNYRPSDVRYLLEFLYDREAWLLPRVPEDARSLGSGNDRLDLMADVSAAVALLEPHDQVRLMWYYGLGRAVESRTSDSVMLRQTIYRLVEALNNYRGCPATVTRNN